MFSLGKRQLRTDMTKYLRNFHIEDGLFQRVEPGQTGLDYSKEDCKNETGYKSHTE